MTIRPARSEDAAEIAEIWNHNIRHTANTFTTDLKTIDSLCDVITQREKEGKAFFVAELNGHIAGFATYFQFRSGPGYAHTAEHSLMLAEGLQGRGIGRALMEELEQHARAAGIHSLIAGVSGENSSGAAFHKSIGYSQIAVLPEVGYKFGRWMDLVVFQKLL